MKRRKTTVLRDLMAKSVKSQTVVSAEDLWRPYSSPPEASPADHVRARAPSPSLPRDLPDHYGDNLIYLLVRDPYWIYAYWEIRKDVEENALASLGAAWSDVKSILRVHDITEKTFGAPFFDIYLTSLAQDWNIEVKPNRSYTVEIGLLHRDGRFAVLARSNPVTTPRAWMSEVIDEEWMGIDFDKVYALSGGFDVGKSSAELQKLMELRLKHAVSSGSGSGGFESQIRASA